MISTDEVESMARAEVAAAARRCADLAVVAATEVPAAHLGGWSSKAATEYAGAVRTLHRLVQELQDDLRSLVAAVEQVS